MNQIITPPPYSKTQDDDQVRSNTIKVSVIVPIYNAGDRIRRCLDTLLAQTLREIEIICVLDCPTDGTDKVVEEYAFKDDRIVVVRNKRNLHVSGSRNEGLKVAHGEYIGFSDHDDYRDLRMYELLYEKAKSENAEIVVSDVRVIHEDRREEICRFNDPSRPGLVNSVLLPMEATTNKNQLSKSVWHSVYSRAFLMENGITFEDRRTFFEEDTLFNLKAVLLARSIAHVKEVLYVWDKRPDSLSNEWATMIPQKQIKSFSLMADLLKDSDDFEQYKDSLWTLVSNEVNRYYPMYMRLEDNDRASFHDLLNKMDFPLFGRYNLKLVSKKRLKLFFFVLKAKYA